LLTGWSNVFLQVTTLNPYNGKPLLRYCLLVEARPGGGTDSQCTAYLRSYLYKVGAGQQGGRMGLKEHVACWYEHDLSDITHPWASASCEHAGTQGGAEGMDEFIKLRHCLTDLNYNYKL
jgi:hypothetical protein